MTALIPSLMDSEKLLSVFANVAVVLPAMVAVLACGRFLSERRQKRLRLENHLREMKLFEYSGQRMREQEAGGRPLKSTLVKALCRNR